MRSVAPLAAVLLAAGSCGEPPAPGRAPSPREAQARDFTRAMKTLDLQYANLHADLAEGKPADVARARLAPIRGAAEAASRLPYREAEAENRELAFEFRKFLDEAGRLERADWAGDAGLASWRRLGAACASCHDLYRQEDR